VSFSKFEYGALASHLFERNERFAAVCRAPSHRS